MKYPFKQLSESSDSWESLGEGGPHLLPLLDVIVFYYSMTCLLEGGRQVLTSSPSSMW